MNLKNIIVPKTARYFVSGKLGVEVSDVWFICHGYGQLANYFLKHFEVLNNGSSLLVAPEGLHRFYVKGFNERVGASWMTKEDRLTDIEDYVNFLDSVYEEVMASFTLQRPRVTVLGFSQGAATVSRWLAKGKVRADRLILWAGAFPPDLDLKTDKAVFDRLKIHIAVGDQDEFINDQQVKDYRLFLAQNSISYTFHSFQGKHEINAELLLKLAEEW